MQNLGSLEPSIHLLDHNRLALGTELLDWRPVARAAAKTFAEVGEEELAFEVVGETLYILLNVFRPDGPTVHVKYVIGPNESRIEGHSKQFLWTKSEAIAIFENDHDVTENAQFAWQLELYDSFILAVPPHLLRAQIVIDLVLVHAYDLKDLKKWLVATV